MKRRRKKRLKVKKENAKEREEIAEAIIKIGGREKGGEEVEEGGEKEE